MFDFEHSFTEIDPKPMVEIGFVIRETPCWNEYAFLEDTMDIYSLYYHDPSMKLKLPGYPNTSNYEQMPDKKHECTNMMTLGEFEPAVSFTDTVCKNETFTLTEKYFVKSTSFVKTLLSRMFLGNLL